MLIALQEDMLPGRTALERFEQAQALGVDGIEVWGRGLEMRVHELAEATMRSGLPVAAVNHGNQSRMLDPHPLERDRALTELRSSVMCASDLGAKGVIFVPHFFGPVLPDLTPYMTAEALEAELLIAHLRTLEDFAAAMSVELYVEPINRYETHFLNRLEQAALITRRLAHPGVKIVADLFHMALEEASIPDAIRAHAADIGHVHLADSNRRLPGQGQTDWAGAAAALNEIGYAGWAAFEPGKPSANAEFAGQYLRDLPDCLKMLRDAGF